jgi:CRP/FNR family cyclic AMP-dependent transcriptional regulator
MQERDLKTDGYEIRLDDSARILSQFELLADLDRHTQQQMAARMHRHVYPAEQVIVLAGEPSRAVYLIARGTARIQRSSPQGREYVLHSLGAGQFFNLSSALDGGYNLATVTTLTETVAYAIPVDVFRQIVSEHPELAMALLEHLASRVRHLCDAVEGLALYTVRTRLARCLLSPTNGDAPAVKYWTQGELAAHIGTVRDVVGRTLRTFSREGLIRRERGRVVVTDPAGLRREALREPEPQYAALSSGKQHKEFAYAH